MVPRDRAAPTLACRAALRQPLRPAAPPPASIALRRLPDRPRRLLLVTQAAGSDSTATTAACRRATRMRPDPQAAPCASTRRWCKAELLLRAALRAAFPPPAEAPRPAAEDRAAAAVDRMEAAAAGNDFL